MRIQDLAPLLLLWLLSIAAPVSPQPRDGLRDTITTMAAGETSADRRAAIGRALESAGVPFDLENFASARGAGANIVVRPLGTAAPSIVIGAHYDRVSVGRGVIDNGSACAALVQIAAALASTPLTHHTAAVVFFDLEESGLAGSRAYFERRPRDNRPAYAINLDVFAYGDTLFATESRKEGRLERALREAAQGTGLAVRTVPVSRYPGSDHLSMITAGIDTLGLALVDAADVDGVLALGELTPQKLGTGPRIMRLLHSPNDTLEAARPDDVRRAMPVVERMLRLVDDAK